MEFDRSSSQGIIIKSVLLFALILITAYRYGKSAIKNSAYTKNTYQIVIMKFTKTIEKEEGVFIELSGKIQPSGETITINHPVQERVWKHQKNNDLAVIDQYDLFKNPEIEVRIQTETPTNYLIVDARF